MDLQGEVWMQQVVVQVKMVSVGSIWIPLQEIEAEACNATWNHSQVADHEFGNHSEVADNKFGETNIASFKAPWFEWLAT